MVFLVFYVLGAVFSEFLFFGSLKLPASQTEDFFAAGWIK